MHLRLLYSMIWNMKKVLVSYCLLVFLIGVAFRIEPALAVFPGDNGRVLFTDTQQSCGTANYNINPNGTWASGSAPNVCADSFAYSPLGDELVYVDGNQDLWKSSIDGTNPVKLIGYDCPSFPAWSPDGLFIAYISGCNDTGMIHYYLVFINAGTGELLNVSDRGINTDYGKISWSPDGQALAISIGGQIYVMEIETLTTTQLTTSSGYNSSPDWSPDGTQIVFASSRDGNGNYEIYKMNFNGTAQTRLTNNLYVDSNPLWSPDGTKIVFSGDRADSGVYYTELYTMNTNGTEEALLYDPGFNGSASVHSWQPTNVTPFVYRYWSDSKRHHFYTASLDEAAYVIDNLPEWGYEGVAYQAKTGSCTGGQSAIYRFWSDRYQGHFYTISALEKQHVIDAYDDFTWRYEGEAFCGDTSQTAGTVPLYRFWSNVYKGHFYTSNEAEKQHVIDAYDDSTWAYEGVAYYVE